ncbi:EpsG family protein [Acinetobacter sp. YH12099]|uniref:EpsG family protein n=1 Tax=Acinetobacter sp. YH12099 TaxID=2601088 RepID=UPI0015D2A6F0|nr:EpsG family protein [Acinetobacter sp. YH12099]
MLPYFFILFMVIFWIWIEQVSFSRKAVFFPLFVLVTFFSIRNFSVGTDTVVYTDKFRNSLSAHYYEFNPEIELGYQFIEYSLLNITDNYLWLFFTSALFVISIYLFVIKRFSNNYILSVFIYITFGFYTFLFNGLRQGIAMAVCFLALPYLINKNKLKYFLLIVIASLFHTSAWVMLPFYFLVHMKLRLEYKMLITFLSSFLISGILISYFAEQNSRYEEYAQVSESSGGYILLMFYFILGLLLYFLGRKERFLNHNYKIFEQVYLCGLLFMIPIALLGTNPSGPQRMLNYFTPMLIFLIPILVSKFKTSFVVYVFYMCMVIFYYLTTTRFSNLTPYLVNPVFEIF